LNQLGGLYDSNLNLPEEAVTFLRQAADIYVETGDLQNEGKVRSNIAYTLCRLKRYDGARAEIMRAIECFQPFGTAVGLWKSFEILRLIEEATENHAAARAAWARARDAYLAYRRQGGYAQQGDGNLVEHVVGLLAQQKVDEIEALFNQLAGDPNADDSRKAIIQAMRAIILNGARDQALGDDPALNYADAAEVLFLIERLPQVR